MSESEIISHLFSIKDDAYRTFAASLLPPDIRMLGIRLPALRKYAAELFRAGYTSSDIPRTGWFEESMLRAFLIGKISNTDTALAEIETFLPEIDNWSVCDSFVASLNIAKREPARMLAFVQSKLCDSREFTVRFAVVMLLWYYAQETRTEENLSLLRMVSHPGYFAEMAVAWAIQKFYTVSPNRVLIFLTEEPLSHFVREKAISKILDSKKTSAGQRKLLLEIRQQINNQMNPQKIDSSAIE